MSSNLQRTTGVEYEQRTSSRRSGSPSVSSEELFELFGDEHTRAVLEAVTETPRSGRAVAEATDVSKPTAFRRLNRLEDAGLVTTEMVVDADGHHHKEYRSLVQSVSFELDADGLSVDVAVEQPRASATARRAIPADD
jgi:predicted transcriptional regulator